MSEAVVRVEKVMTGTEVDRIMRELAAYGFACEPYGDGWFVTVEGVDDVAAAREVVRDRLAKVSETWSIHLRIPESLPPLTDEEYAVIKKLLESQAEILASRGMTIEDLADPDLAQDWRDIIATLSAYTEGYEATHPPADE